MFFNNDLFSMNLEKSGLKKMNSYFFSVGCSKKLFTITLLFDSVYC